MITGNNLYKTTQCDITTPSIDHIKNC